MKTIKQIILVIVLTLSCMVSKAQQNPMFTHYMYNTLVVNPAYAGSRDALTVTALHRSQWVDFKGAPLTQTFSMHTPLPNQNLGLGLSLMNDKLGPINNTSLSLSFAYRIKVSEKAKLALGINAGGNMLQANLNTLQLDEQSDPVFANNINKRFTPNVGVGAYYSMEKFYAGLSAPSLLQNNYSSVNQANGNTLVAKEQRHYFLIVGAVLRISDYLAFKPTTLVKATVGAPMQADFTASFIIHNKLSVGAMFRTGDAFGALLGIDINKQLRVGYSYDWSYGLSSARYNQGSHEIMLRYDFIFPSSKQIHSPRYF